MYFLSDPYGKRIGMTGIVAVETVNTSYLHTVGREGLKAQKIITSHPQRSFPPFHQCLPETDRFVIVCLVIVGSSSK